MGSSVLETKLSVSEHVSTPELDHEFKFIDLKIVGNSERVAIVGRRKVDLKTFVFALIAVYCTLCRFPVSSVKRSH